MILRVRSRNGTDHITMPDAASATVGDLRRFVKARATLPILVHRFSLDLALLLPAAQPPLLLDPLESLSSPPPAPSTSGFGRARW